LPPIPEYDDDMPTTIKGDPACLLDVYRLLQRKNQVKDSALSLLLMIEKKLSKRFISKIVNKEFLKPSNWFSEYWVVTMIKLTLNTSRV
jgi:siderophore synthetase component